MAPDTAVGRLLNGTELEQAIANTLRIPDCLHVHTSWPQEDVRTILQAIERAGYAVVKRGDVPPWMVKAGEACTHCGHAFIQGDREPHTHRFTDPPLSTVYVVDAGRAGLTNIEGSHDGVR